MLRLVGMITNNPMLLLWIALAAFATGLVSGGGAAWTVQGWRLEVVKAEYKSFKDHVELLGKQAEKDKKRIEADHAKVTKEIKDAIPKQIASARTNAVRNYIARMPVDTSSSGVRRVAGLSEGIHESAKEPVSSGCDEGFIRDSAEDAATITGIQSWVRGIGFPVK